MSIKGVGSRRNVAVSISLNELVLVHLDHGHATRNSAGLISCALKACTVQLPSKTALDWRTVNADTIKNLTKNHHLLALLDSLVIVAVGLKLGNRPNRRALAVIRRYTDWGSPILVHRGTGLAEMSNPRLALWF